MKKQKILSNWLETPEYKTNFSLQTVLCVENAVSLWRKKLNVVTIDEWSIYCPITYNGLAS